MPRERRSTSVIACCSLAYGYMRQPPKAGPRVVSWIAIEHVFSWTELDRMLGECDIVVLSCALTPETTGLIDGRRLAAMKPGAFLINLARGPIAEERALSAAFADGASAGPGLPP